MVPALFCNPLSFPLRFLSPPLPRFAVSAKFCQRPVFILTTAPVCDIINEMNDQSVIFQEVPMRRIDNDKRLNILEQAKLLFVENGFANTSIQDIAQAAGIAKGTIYLYFANKEKLIDEVFWHCHLQDVEACDRGLELLESATEKLCLRMENAIRFALEHPAEATIERMYLSSPVYGSMGSGYADQKLQFQSVDAIMRNGVERGELKDLPTPLLGEIFFGIAAAFYFYFNANPDLAEDPILWEKSRQSVRDCLAR